jgi:hypothetical protein
MSDEKVDQVVLVVREVSTPEPVVQRLKGCNVCMDWEADAFAGSRWPPMMRCPSCAGTPRRIFGPVTRRVAIEGDEP